MSNRRERKPESYKIDAAIKVVKVLEALAGDGFEPVTQARICQRLSQETEFNFDPNFVLRALKTLELIGYARFEQTGKLWSITGKPARLVKV